MLETVSKAPAWMANPTDTDAQGNVIPALVELGWGRGTGPQHSLALPGWGCILHGRKGGVASHGVEHRYFT